MTAIAAPDDDDALDKLRTEFERNKARAIESADKAAYNVKRSDNAERNARKSKAGRDISPIPPVANPARREACWNSFRLFCEVYFKSVFTLAWSADHLKTIAKIEAAVLTGGTFAMALPRGSGKSSLSECAVIWAALTGRSQFIVLIAATGDMASAMLGNIRTALESNDLLAEDFPECCHAIQKLEGIVGRCAGQHCGGVPTKIVWKANRLILPTIAGAASSGVIISCTGLTAGGIRGQRLRRSDGSVARPSLVIIDDPQSSESAWSISQCERREKLLSGDVLGMAGPGKKIAGILSCTVIRPGDLADRVLDRKLHPQWVGERCKLLVSPPTNEKLWDEYREIRDSRFRSDGKELLENAFYEINRAAMDSGAVVSWPERFNEDELSAVQHCMNLKFRDEAAFASEYQNEPMALSTAAAALLDEQGLRAKIEPNRQRGVVPDDCDVLTGFIDCHDKLLYWGVGAFKQDGFTCSLLDYNAYPDQKRSYFTLDNAKISMAMKSQGSGKDGALLAGIVALIDQILSRIWKRADGTEFQVRRLLIDSGYATQIVMQAIKQCKYPALVMPSKGFGVTASKTPFSEYTRHPGDRAGLDWRIAGTKGTAPLRIVSIDTNTWKTRLMTALATALGDRGCLSLPGKNGKKVEDHRMLIEHILSESSTPTFGRGRSVNEWKKLPGRSDNHLLDVLVGMFVAASMEGCSTVSVQPRPKVVRKTRKARYFGDAKPAALPASKPAAAPATQAAPTRGPQPVKRQPRKPHYF